MTKKDIMLIFSLLIISLAGFAFIHFRSQGNQTATAEISVNGQVVQRIDLKKIVQQTSYTVQGPLGNTLIQVKPGEARIIDSPCPDKICVRMGWIKLPGQSAICIPNRVILSIVTSDNQIDSIAR